MSATRTKAAALAAVLFGMCAASARASQSFCQVNTGLDPACPQTAIGAGDSSQTLDAAANGHTDTIFGSFARHDRQIDVTIPIHRQLGIAGAGAAYGLGDSTIGYSQVLWRDARLSQTAGISAILSTGAQAFSAGRNAVAPAYALSYAVGDRIRLVAIGAYRFDVGGTKLPFAPRTQALHVIPRAIFDVTKSGAYAAFDVQGASITGQERYQSYLSDATIGAVHGHENVSFTYTVPIARYTREHVLYHSIGLKLSWRP
jgi:hypothetical protein